jgi:adiponectin receptor
MKDSNSNSNSVEDEKSGNIIESTEGEEDEAFQNNKEDIEIEKDLSVGNYEEAPKFMQDNEYIKKGYLLHCTTFKSALKSLFKCHNETINIWSHLLGAIFFFFLIFFTSVFITNFKSQLQLIRNDLQSIKEKAEFLYNENYTKMDSIYNSIKMIKYDYDNFEKETIYEESLKKLFSITNDFKNLTAKIYNYLFSSFLDTLSSFKEEIYSLKEKILDLIKLDFYKSDKLENDLDDQFDLSLEKRKIKELARWPLFIIIHSAILCFLFSASFHSIGTINEKIHDILNRFDYGGISILISGSCYPPYYYFFYYDATFRYFYLIEISIFGLGIFLYSLTDDFNKPKRRTLRGILFLIFGLCTGIPVLHMAFFGDKIEGYGPGIKLINWYLGGISYVAGAILYIIRFPEKIFPGKFDYIGASHQIFHILVFLGALFHFFGSIDAYNYRFLNLKIEKVE